MTRRPEKLALLPEDVTRQLALQEKDVFLARIQGGQTTGDKAKSRPHRLISPMDMRFPGLRLVGKYLPEDERRSLIAAIFEQMKASTDREIDILLPGLTQIAGSLTPQQCVAVLELLEPSPFGSSKTAPVVHSSYYRKFVAAVPSEAADEVARWLLERIQTATKPAEHYGLGLCEVAPACDAKTAGAIMAYFAENQRAAISRSNWPAVAAIGKVVPAAQANALAEKLIGAAREEPDGAIAAAQLRLAGVLCAGDPEMRYRAFEMILEKIGYDPTVRTGATYRSDPRKYVLSRSYSPAMAAILSNLPPEGKQRAFKKLMDTLSGEQVTLEAVALVEGLNALSPDLSPDDADAAFAKIVQLNAADPRQHREMPHRVTAFLAKRPPEEHPRLIKMLALSIVQGRFRIKTYPVGSSDPVVVMSRVAGSLSSAGACETLTTMIDLMLKQRGATSLLFFEPIIQRIAPGDRETVAQDLVRRMQKSDVPSHTAILGQCVARLGSSVSEETCAAAIDRLIDLFQSYLVEQKTAYETLCVPAGELLRRLPNESAGPRRDRMVKLLCLVVYESDSLPENAQIRKVQGDRDKLGVEMAKVFASTRAEVPPDVMKTMLYCIASLAMEAHGVSQEKMLGSLRTCAGTAPRGEGRLAKACLAGAVGEYHLAANIHARDCIVEVLADKLDDADVMPVYRVAWETYCQAADSAGRNPMVSFGRCLKPLASRMPAESAWSAFQDILQRWPTEKRDPHRRLLNELYRAIVVPLPDKERAKIVESAKQTGLSLEPIPEVKRAVPRRTIPRRSAPSRTQREIALEDIANPEERWGRLWQFLNSNHPGSCDERLEVVQRLDEKGYLMSPIGELHEPVRRWFCRNLPPGSADSIAKAIGRPDCVGLQQRLFTSALAAQNNRDSRSDLWELAEFFPAAE